MKQCSSRSNWCLLSVIDQRLRIDTCRYLIEILSRRITGD
ncbi:uncharacterized protein LOC111594090 [Drosophila hydei]|uniref:Uncharacterized protein LOC111594090 n=1 Tax=Drosophila hydei TaxID=7224 RepID=A0A6J1LCM0_DROHY|nr:uncharacterized protein LOC111594090 [Drosophila hydei]XP_023163006.1 uncharacterized protein LOC111594090 [Drosophila hydei]